MIPLAQYLSDIKDDEFVPFRPAERRGFASFERERDAAVVRPLKPVAVRPAPVPVVPDMRERAPETVPLDELRTARAAWASEKALLEEAAATDRAAALAACEARLRAEFEAATQARLDEMQAAHEASYAADLAATREAWTSEQADRLADCMILQMALFEDSMRSTVRAVLRPLATEARQRQAIEDLADAVKVIAPEGQGYRIAATGPSDLLAKFRDRLGDKATRLSVRPDETATDIRVEAAATAIETRLEAWGRALEKALS